MVNAKEQLLRKEWMQFMETLFYEKRAHNQSEDFFAGTICDHPFPVHVHDVVEVVCLTQGQVEMNIGGESISILPGDIAIVFPAVPHSYKQVSKDARGLALIFLPGIIQEFQYSFRTKTPERCIVKNEDKNEMLNTIIEQFINLTPPESRVLKQGYLHLFLSYLFMELTLNPVDQPVEMGLSYNALHYISQHYTEPLSLESTAHALGVSRMHLSHVFSQKLKISFRHYINMLRIDMACFMLRDPAYSISQIAYTTGYGNPRTFHRAFMQMCEMTPREFRAKIAGLSADTAQEK